MKVVWDVINKVFVTCCNIGAVLMLSAAGSIATLVLIQYAIGHPERSAWTGVAPMSSPSAVCHWLVSGAVLILFFTKRI